MSESDTGEVSSTTEDGLPGASVLISPANEALAQAVESITGIKEEQQDHGVLSSQLSLASVSQPAMSLTTQVVMAAPGVQQAHLMPITESLSLDQQVNHGGTIIAEADPGTMVAAEDQVILASNTATQGLGDTTFQSLMQGGIAHVQGTNGETIQIIAVSQASDLSANKIWHVLPTASLNNDIATIIVNQPQQQEADPLGQLVAGQNVPEVTVRQQKAKSSGTTTATQVVDMVPVSSVQDGISNIIQLAPSSHVTQNNLPPGSPSWALKLIDGEKIGDAYRGWVKTEVELDLLLTYHKQQTSSFWGTRQSPSPAKQSTRLMWKSQYVPFDGIPFVNTGSRAVVMECQFGPRRKGSAHSKRDNEGIIKDGFKQTCPARIYVKKVRKFPEFMVDITQDKKTLKLAMDRAFMLLRERNLLQCGEERFYVQLPTEQAHEFHGDIIDILQVDKPHRLHPRVSQKIRDMVAAGETRLYVIRKALRRFVERELFESAECIPEKHNLSYYPTVNDLQNHIHQAIKDIESGLLPVTAQTVNVEVMTAAVGDPGDDGTIDSRLWNSVSQEEPHAETVTVTLTQNPGEEGHHVISRVETHLSDGSTRISNTLTPETAQLLSKLHPNMFPPDSLIQLQDGGSSLSSKIQSIALSQTGLLQSQLGLQKEEPPDGLSSQDSNNTLDTEQSQISLQNEHSDLNLQSDEQLQLALGEQAKDGLESEPPGADLALQGDQSEVSDAEQGGMSLSDSAVDGVGVDSSIQLMQTDDDTGVLVQHGGVTFGGQETGVTFLERSGQEVLDQAAYLESAEAGSSLGILEDQPEQNTVLQLDMDQQHQVSQGMHIVSADGSVSIQLDPSQVDGATQDARMVTLLEDPESGQLLLQFKEDGTKDMEAPPVDQGVNSDLETTENKDKDDEHIPIDNT